MKRNIILIIMIIFLLESKAIAGYVEKINLKVTAQIARPVLNISHDEKISGSYSDISKIPEYFFEIKNYDNENKVSEVNSYINLEVVSNNKIDFEIIDCATNEVILNKNVKVNDINIEKNKQTLKRYKLVLEDNTSFAKDSLKLIINAKYYDPKELEIFDINFDKRALTAEVFASEQDKKYTNNDVMVQIKCNKEIKAVSGFNLSDDKMYLTKIYQNNSIENIVIEDYFGNKKDIEISITNIDKMAPEILGVEDGKTYEKSVNLIYKDNVGVKNIRVENSTKKQKYDTSFDIENRVIDNQFLVVNNTINPYYLNQSGSYIITVEDFAGNKTVKHTCIK